MLQYGRCWISITDMCFIVALLIWVGVSGGRRAVCMALSVRRVGVGGAILDTPTEGLLTKYVWAHFNSPTSKRPYMATTTPVATGKHNPLQIMERQSTWVTSLVPGFEYHLALSHRGKSSVTFSIPRLSLIKLSAGISVLPTYLVAFFLRGGEPRNVSVTLRGRSHLLPLRFDPPNVTIPPACIRRNEPGDEAKPDKAIRWNVRPTW